MLQSMGVAKSRTQPSVSTELKPGFKEFRKPCCTLGKAFSLQMEPKRGALQIQPTEPPRPRTALPLCPRGHSWTEAPPAQPRHSLERRAGRGLPLSAPWTPASLAAGPCVCVRLRVRVPVCACACVCVCLRVPVCACACVCVHLRVPACGSAHASKCLCPPGVSWRWECAGEGVLGCAECHTPWGQGQ